MTGPSSVSSFYRFDVARGVFETSREADSNWNGEGTRVLQIPEDVLSTLIAAAEQQDNLAAFRRLGSIVARHAASFLTEEIISSGPEDVTHALSMALRLFGFGDLAVECWGDLLVFRLGTPPRLEKLDRVIGEILSGLLIEFQWHWRRLA